MARWSAEKRAEVRSTIIECAKDEFERSGFETATMRAIAEHSGVAVGTLFNYFPDKVSLLETALFEDLEELAAHAVPDESESESLSHFLTQASRPFLEYYAERPALSRQLLRATMFSDRDSPFREQVEAFAARLVQSVERLKSRGIVRPDASSQAIVLAFFGHYYFVLMSELGRSSADQMVSRIQLLVSQLERGVALTESP